MALGQSFQIAVSTASDIEKALTRLYGVGGPEADVEVFPSGGRRAEAIDLNAAAASAPVIGRVNGVIRKAIEEGASDIHFEPQAHGLVVRARVDGVMRHLDTIPIEMQQAVVSRLKIMGELDIAERRAPQDGRVSITFGRTPMDLRMAVLPSTYGEQVVLRIIYLKGSRSLELSSLGMSEQAAQVFLDAISQPSGAIITCGPTGSGKTTTLYAGLSLLNQEDRVLMTIEDPVELQLDGVNQIEVNVRAGLTFTRGLRTILRSDPDILLVGEIRDEETARIAVQASMTGHLVLTTLHALDAASSIARLKDMGVPPSLLAASVNCVVAQRLARRLCQQCRQPYDLPVSKLAEAGFREELLPDGASVTLYRPGTCVECEGGYIGRVGLYEIMQLNSEIRDRIDASTDAISAAALANGMQTIREDGLRLSLEGHTSLDEVRRVSGDWMP
jgi:type II secretory ATPase GspE/PulE/Tfp pilus assembly ATPase PilB-like protein